ncbi:hypothetical protein JCM10908_005368 [Rhodotorula pacifica]|uniref:deoxycytidine monophosphate deaminase n=1 Tax=Rhodotorula pacifica TaxID=1495444 RepID=UPI0031778C0D
MLICLVGPPQSGKNSLADHLVAHHGYERVHLASSSSSSSRQPASSAVYASSSEFLDHATRTWRRNYVTTDLTSKQKLVEFAKRPFVAIVAVDAPLGVRFRRAVAAAKERGEAAPSLEDFVARDDLLYHGALPLLVAGTSSSSDNTSAHDALARLDLAELPPTTPGKQQQRLAPSSSSDVPPSPSPSPARQITPIPSPELHRNTGMGGSSDYNARGGSSSDKFPSADATLAAILPLAHLTLPNPHSTLGPFLSSFSLPILSELLRPSWDTYFMLLASLASLRSNCMKRRVGAVLVRDKRVVSTGYNGTPRGVRNCGEGGCGRCNSHGDGWGKEEEGHTADGDVFSPSTAAVNGDIARRPSQPARNLSRVGEALDECLCLHAEENALLEAGRERVSGGGTEGAVLYCNTCPCLRCTVKIVQCGVKEVIYSLSYSMDTASRRVMEEAGIVLRQIPQPAFPR